MDRPIGVFDSGLGGLTVARAIRRALPRERLVYLGDTARVPYGTRSPATVVRYARACGRRLAEHDIKLLVVACNTVSAVALDILRVELDVPVLGVIEPGARAGVAASRSGKVGVIATAGTVASGAYDRALSGVDTRIQAFVRPAPLLVPLAEEGWTAGDVPALAIEHYLEPLVGQDVDVIVLGCTHYPLLAPIIAAVAGRVLGPALRIVDSADATAAELGALLEERGLAASAEAGGGLVLLVTDRPRHFVEVASRFLGEPVEELAAQLIDL